MVCLLSFNTGKASAKMRVSKKSRTMDRPLPTDHRSTHLGTIPLSVDLSTQSNEHPQNVPRFHCHPEDVQQPYCISLGSYPSTVLPGANIPGLVPSTRTSLNPVRPIARLRTRSGRVAWHFQETCCFLFVSSSLPQRATVIQFDER